MIPGPASKYSDIIVDLVEIGDQLDYTPYIFRLNHYKVYAEKTIHDDPEGAYTLLGIIACIKGDIEAMHKNHKIAIQCSGQSVISIHQYCCSLLRHNFYESAKKYALIAFSKRPEDRGILIKLMISSYCLGDILDYEKYKEKLDKLGFEYEDPNQFYEDDPEWLTQAIKSVDKLIEENPQMLVEQDADLEALVDDLIEGVDIS